MLTIDLGKAETIDRVVVHCYFNGSTFESHAVQVSLDGNRSKLFQNSGTASGTFVEDRAHVSTPGCSVRPCINERL